MLFNLTDGIVLLSALIFAFTGWRKGFLRSLNGPLSLVICVVLGVLYFRKTQNVILCLAISIIGPLVLNFILGLLFDLFQKADNQLNLFTMISRLAGMFISLSWSGAMLIFSIFLVSLLPAQFLGTEKVRQNVTESRTYALIAKILNRPRSAEMSTAEVKDQEREGRLSNQKQENARKSDALKGLEGTEEFKVLMSDPRIQAIFKDPETMNQIQKQDLPALLRNPKIFTIVQDPELLKRFFQMYKKIQESEQKSNVSQVEYP